MEGRFVFKRTVIAAAFATCAALTGQGIPAIAAPQETADFSIVNGQDQAATDYPEVVYLSIPIGDSSVAACGGTIIDDHWILTAAHCLADSDPNATVTVTAFTPYGKAEDGRTYGTRHTSKRFFIHPKFKENFESREITRGKYDVALVELENNISTGYPMNPKTRERLNRFPDVELAVPTVTLARAGEELPRQGTARVVGRGASWWESINAPGVMNAGRYRANPDLLESAEVPVLNCPLDTLICAEQQIDINRLNGIPESERHHRTNHRHPASCVGDSGGPLFVTEHGQRRQVGIVSHSRYTPQIHNFWGDDICGRVGTMYSSVSYVRPWVEHVMHANLAPGAPAPHIYLQTPPYAAPNSGNQQGPVQPPASEHPKPDQPVPPAPAPVPVPDAPAPPTPAPDAPKAPETLPSRPGDPALLKNVPVPSDGPMRWTLPKTQGPAGSEIAAGVNRLRAAFKDLPKSTEPSAKRIALLASETKMADALASGVLQNNASLYLTSPDKLEPFILNEIKAMGIHEVWLLGGPMALSPAVEQALQANGLTTRRIAGSDRTQTAVEIAKAQATRTSRMEKDRFIARAFGDQGDETRSWADSIALGGLAAKTGRPILLTQTDKLSASMLSQLTLGVQATVVGGHAAVNPSVADTIATVTGSTVNRIAGANRADTAGQIAHKFQTPQRAIVIDGQGENAWQLGFSLAGLSNDLNAPILLTAGTTVPPETKKVLKDLNLQNVICMGELQVCEAVEQASNQ